MDAETKAGIGARLRMIRERAGYTREEMGELCSLSPRFIANIELGDSTFSMDSLMTVCRVLSCSADHLLFGDTLPTEGWEPTAEKLSHLDVKYRREVEALLQCVIEVILKAERNI